MGFMAFTTRALTLARKCWQTIVCDTTTIIGQSSEPHLQDFLLRPDSTAIAPSIVAQCERAKVYLAERELQSALSQLDAAIALIPSLAALYRNRACIHREVGDFASAGHDLDEAIRLRPAFWLARSGRADVNLASGHIAQALRDLEAILPSSNDVASLGLKRAMANWTCVTELSDLDFPEPRDVTVCENLILGANVDGNSSIAEVSDRLVMRAEAWRSASRHDRAFADLRAAIRLNPGNAVAYNNRSLLLHAMHCYVDALADATTAISLDPECGRFYSNRGVIKAAVRDYAGAVADYEACIRLSPDEPYSYKNMSLLMATCIDRRLRDGQAAVENAELALKLGGSDEPELLLVAASAYAELGDVAAAQASVAAYLRSTATLERDSTATPARSRQWSLAAMFGWTTVIALAFGALTTELGATTICLTVALLVAVGLKLARGVLGATGCWRWFCVGASTAFLLDQIQFAAATVHYLESEGWDLLNRGSFGSVVSMIALGCYMSCLYVVTVVPLAGIIAAGGYIGLRGFRHPGAKRR